MKLSGAIEYTKAFLSGLFAGMANDQAKRRDHGGTKWRAQLALRWACHPYSKFFAHAVNAKAEILGSNRPGAGLHVREALDLFMENADLRGFPEVRSMVDELRAMHVDL
jgi:hypothetical protein